MNIVYGLLTGSGRTEQAREIIKAWHDVRISVWLYTWDEHDLKTLGPLCDHVLFGPMDSFVINHNRLARELDWDIYICGANDLYPGTNPFLRENLLDLYESYPDKSYFINDGWQNRIPSHPIVPRQWWLNRDKVILDEQYEHNFVDDDFLAEGRVKGDIIRCTDICLDHRQFTRMGQPADFIAQKGQESFERDRARFEMKWNPKPDNPYPTVSLGSLHSDYIVRKV